MKLQDWIQIGGYVLLAIATFAGPVVAARKSSRDQDNVAPDKRAQGWFLRLLKSPWIQSPWILPPLLILNYIVQLIFDLRKTGPVTRSAVFDIAFDVAGVLWGVWCVFMNGIGQDLRYQAEHNHALLEIVKDILEFQSSQWERYRAFQLKLLDVIESIVEGNHSSVERLSLATEQTILATEKSIKSTQDALMAMSEELDRVSPKSKLRAAIRGFFGGL
jgi:hypothetical protein